MHPTFIARLLTAAATVALNGLWLSPAVAQDPPPGAFRVPQQVVNQPTNQTQVANIQAALGANFTYNPYLNTVGPNGYYGGGYYPSRAGSYLNGVAAVTTANAQYQATIQQARIIQQTANQSAYDTRRKALDEWRYEQSLKPSPEDVAEAERAQALRRARNDPPPTEIWSGTAGNALLASIQRMQTGGLRGPLVPLDEEVLRHINLSAGTTVGSVGLFRDGGKLQWPFVLKKKIFEMERMQIEELAPLAVRQAMSGEVGFDTLEGLTETTRALGNKVDSLVKDLTPNEFVQAMRYVNELKRTVKALQDPNVAKQFNGAWSAKGSNVAELIDSMTKQGLKFAAATRGDEPSYTVLYRSLLSYDMGLAQLVSR